MKKRLKALEKPRSLQEGLVLRPKASLAALEKAKSEKEAHGEFEERSCPGYCVAQDTFYVGNMKGVGRIYQQNLHRHLPPRSPTP